MAPEPTPTKPELRALLRARRRAVPPDAATAAAAAVARRAWQLPQLMAARRIAGYFPVGAELDCRPLLDAARARGRQVFLPIVQGLDLWFAPWKAGTPMALNRHGIPEPDVARRHWRRARELDVVLAPLVGFDGRGVRLGMGGGYYDRALQLQRHAQNYRRPAFVGIAYECQLVVQLPADPWDARLSAAITEVALHRFHFVPDP